MLWCFLVMVSVLWCRNPSGPPGARAHEFVLRLVYGASMENHNVCWMLNVSSALSVGVLSLWVELCLIAVAGTCSLNSDGDQAARMCEHHSSN